MSNGHTAVDSGNRYSNFADPNSRDDFDFATSPEVPQSSLDNPELNHLNSTPDSIQSHSIDSGNLDSDHPIDLEELNPSDLNTDTFDDANRNRGKGALENYPSGLPTPEYLKPGQDPLELIPETPETPEDPTPLNKLPPNDASLTPQLPSSQVLIRGDSLSKDTKAGIDQDIANFRKGDTTPEKFYEDIRAKIYQALENTFGRKIGEQP